MSLCRTVLFRFVIYDQEIWIICIFTNCDGCWTITICNLQISVHNNSECTDYNTDCSGLCRNEKSYNMWMNQNYDINRCMSTIHVSLNVSGFILISKLNWKILNLLFIYSKCSPFSQKLPQTRFMQFTTFLMSGLIFCFTFHPWQLFHSFRLDNV